MKEEIVLPRDRIAILPFASFSSNPDDAYFADGITDEIISAVAGISGLSVISRTSVVGYKGTTKKVKEIGKELEVGSILEGTFKKAGNRIRVTSQLIDVASDRHLWSQTYDRNLDDVFEVQSDVAKQVADALRVKILTSEMQRIGMKPTENTMAYTLYLKGRFLWNKRGLAEIESAIGFFEQAVKEDPGFALGYLGLADCFLILRNNFGVKYDPGQSKAMAMIEKAIELDPLLAEAQASMGALLEADYRLKDAEERDRKAIELKPNYAFAHMWYSNLLYDEGRLDESLVEIEKALELDPLSPVTNYNYALHFWAKRDYPRSLKALERTAELAPDYPRTYMLMSWVNGKLADFESVSTNLAKWVRLEQKSYPKAEVYAKATSAVLNGDKETAKRLLPEVESHLDAGTDACSIARLYFSVGEFDRGFAWLERSFSRREYSLTGIKVDPRFDGVRNDPRYLDLLKRLGLD